MVFTTVDTYGTAFQFGARIDTQQMERQKIALSSSFPSYSSERPAKVSWFFANFDRLVSYTVQRIVAVIVDTVNKEDLIALARERILARVLQGREVDPQFGSLFQLLLQGDCSEFLEKSRLLSEKRYLDPVQGSQLHKDREKYETKLQEIGAQKIVAISSVPLVDYLKANSFTVPNPPNFSCQEIWNMTVKLLEKESSTALTPTVHEQEQFDVPWATVIGSVQLKLCTEWQQDKEKCKSMKSDELPEIAKRIVMAQMVKNTLGTTPHSMFTSQVAGHGIWENGDDHRRLLGDVVSMEQNSYRFLISYLAATIPYLQGLLLYMLSAMFPFFAIFFLLPGRYTAFLVWPFLWLWVKSWDVGYAIVYLFREVLWDLFPYVGQARGAENFDKMVWDSSNPIYLFNLVYGGDPTANASLYWTIVGCLTLAVPCVTGYLCLGTSELFNAFKMAFEDTPLGMQDDRRNESEGMLAGRMDKHVNRNYAVSASKENLEARRNPGKVYPIGGAGLVDSAASLIGVDRRLAGDNTYANYITASGNFGKAMAQYSPETQGMMHARNALLGRPNGLPNPTNYMDLVNFTMNSMQEQYSAQSPFLRAFSARPMNDKEYARGGASGFSGAGWGPTGAPSASSQAPSD